ncbi:sulfotransferase domain-containing protein [Allorhizobium sp. BGMRC 0089]|uniref:sulfotransferase domain-containing protein n=1 Tax=Allorhizobium sonneratiae TaxID=2934936 RepID=UPI002033223C|nr:sulfotransferase domain-containing protein [Allorhizobium sonneratiae]MCM2291808.1 sulfotransferase domain-containing protein [Allorhizobium sonneratiae]
MVLRPDGSIYGYAHENESRWSREGDDLCFHHQAGHVTSRFRQSGDRVFLGHVENRLWPLYLVPALTLEKPAGAPDLPPVFINSIPKSGTYFLEAAFARIGYKPTRLHLGGQDTVDDYRNMADAEIHVAPEMSRLNLPVTMVTALMQRGQIMVGHIEHAHVIEEMKRQGILVIHAIRDLRAVLYSLYRFKLGKVMPVDDMDRYWRTLDGEARLTAFIQYYHGRDLEHIRHMAQMMVSYFAEDVLRYEDCCNGVIGDRVARMLDESFAGMSINFSNALRQQVGQETPTSATSHSSWEKMWNDNIQNYFEFSGMKGLNEALGYN